MGGVAFTMALMLPVVATVYCATCRSINPAFKFYHDFCRAARGSMSHRINVDCYTAVAYLYGRYHPAPEPSNRCDSSKPPKTTDPASSQPLARFLLCQHQLRDERAQLLQPHTAPGVSMVSASIEHTTGLCKNPARCSGHADACSMRERTQQAVNHTSQHPTGVAEHPQRAHATLTSWRTSLLTEIS